jgi:hypothetical protein
MLNGGTYCRGDADDIDCKFARERVGVRRRIVNRAHDENTRVVDENVEAPELVRDLLHESFDLFRVGLVSAEGRGAYAVGFKLTDDRLGLARGVRVADRDVGAVFGKRTGNGCADTA